MRITKKRMRQALLKFAQYASETATELSAIDDGLWQTDTIQDIASICFWSMSRSTLSMKLLKEEAESGTAGPEECKSKQP